MNTVLVTGNSSGLGKAFTQQFLNNGATVYGCSRRGCDSDYLRDNPKLHDLKLDLADLDQIESGLKQLLEGVDQLDLVVLNAGILGEIKPMKALTMSELKNLMDINVWSNKLALDWLLEKVPEVKQVVVISSGAAVNGNKGWGAYSLSKATINMLTKLYAAEYPGTHFIALAPGLVDTAMQDKLCDPELFDGDEFPSLQKLRAARGSVAMPTPDVAAEMMIQLFPGLVANWSSGEFVDVRNISS